MATFANAAPLSPPQAEIFGAAPDGQQGILASAQLALSHTVESMRDTLAAGSRKLLPGVAFLAGMAGTGAGVLYDAQPADASGPAVHSTQYLERNCRIVVPVNPFVAGGTHNKKQGVAVSGQKIDGGTAGNPLSFPVVKYTWHIPSSDEFCGIVGEKAGPKGPQDLSLKPTSQTAHGGEYTDTSLNSSNGLHINEFFVYARPKSKKSK
jgi:hypothetical protein